MLLGDNPASFPYLRGEAEKSIYMVKVNGYRFSMVGPLVLGYEMVEQFLLYWGSFKPQTPGATKIAIEGQFGAYRLSDQIDLRLEGGYLT